MTCDLTSIVSPFNNMLPGQQVSFFNHFRFCLFAGVSMLLLSSCLVKKNYPKNIPFVYRTNVAVNGNMSQADKRDLIENLENQLDDSLKPRIISTWGIPVLTNPVIFDTANIDLSKIYMRALLNANGYFYPTIEDTFTIAYKKRHALSRDRDQQRVTTQFTVTTGKRTKIDSVGFDLLTPELQQLAMRSKPNSLLRKNDPYTHQVISNEVDRLLQVFHNNGFYKISRDDVYAEVDTVIAALIDPTLDPFEQLRLLDSLQRKNENPSINVVLKQREARDTTHLKQFFIGKVNVYPDQIYVLDSADVPKLDTTTVQGYPFTFFYSSKRFKLPFIARNVFLFPDSLYRERNYFRTVNIFNRLGSWQNVDVSLTERYTDSVNYLDSEIKLYPSARLNMKNDLEVSRNIADYLTTSQFFGIGVNFSITNRNAFRESIQSSTNARFGIELGSNFIQTLQANLSHSIYFPRLIIPFRLALRTEERAINQRTVFNINGAYTIRREIYDVSSLNTSWTYEWSNRRARSRPTVNWQLTIPNIEYTRLQGKDSLAKLIARIPSLQYAFNDGFVIGVIGGMNTSWIRKNRFTNIKVRLEESGALTGFFRNLERNNLFRYVKTDFEVTNSHISRSGWAFRLFAGFGYVYGTKGDQPENKLPFFKAYFAGGPNSMRAWPVRRLGPGSSIIYDTAASGANDRFGNMQLEANMEYRFNLTSIAGIKVKSAFFIDAGNVWGKEFEDKAGNIKIEEASFAFNRLYKDLAIGGGTSLRFDFEFFLIRLDWAYKLKDPRFSDINSGWFHKLELFDGQFQLGINLPF
ncbi:MAG: BamA/TamA family outer membrane protein [Chitinophagaceae bacterium]|nr:BamA/TamA family outer membrane protein [Chitinophagaceae bacterium]